MRIARHSLALVALIGIICCQRAVSQTRDLYKRIQLPGAFSGYSEDDALGKIFEGYDSTTSTVTSIRNSENRPTMVSILEAKPWRVGREEYLVALTNLWGPERLCGNCAMFAPLAVLGTNGSQLSLLARQDLPSRSSILEDKDLSDISEVFGSLWYSGHQTIALDLAPYRLTDQEMLIGVRIEHMWLPAPFYQTRLILFRMQGKSLRKVFEIPVIDREYPNAGKDGPQIVLKTESTLSTTPSGGSFYRLFIKKTTFKCAENDDGDCDTRNASARRVKTQTEEWRFDGQKFTLVMHPSARPVLPKSNPA